MAGIAEIAEDARVSKQRASQIVENKGFPRPVDRLAMGAVWDRGAVRAYLERTQDRRTPRG